MSFLTRQKTKQQEQPMRMWKLSMIAGVMIIMTAIMAFCIPSPAQARWVDGGSQDMSDYYSGASYYYLFNMDGGGAICYCQHLGRSFNSADYGVARYANTGEQALLTMGYPANEGWCYYNGGWHYLGGELARSATALSCWSVRGMCDPWDGSISFYNADLRDATRYLVSTFYNYRYSGFEMLRFDSAIAKASENIASPTKMDANIDLEVNNLNYEYLEYNGFKVSSDLPTRDLSASLVVKYKGVEVPSSATTYLYDANRGTVSFYKNYLKGKKPGDILILYSARNMYCPSGVLYSRFSTAYQDMLYAPTRQYKSAQKVIAPNWIEIQYKILNDGYGEIVERENMLGAGTRTLRQTSGRDDLEKYHIVTVPRTYSILDEAPEALNVKDCFSTPNLGVGFNKNYYFFTDNWYTDSACTVKFGPEGTSLSQRDRNKAYVSNSIVLYGKWFEAKVTIESDPGWDDTPVSVGQTVKYKIQYTNKNDKTEKVTLFDSPPSNSKFVAGAEEITKFVTGYRGSYIEISHGAVSDAQKKNMLSEQYNDEENKSQEIRELVPDIPVYSVEEDKFVDSE